MSQLLTAKQAAEFLAISERKLWELTHSGKIAATRIGRLMRYTPESLQAFVEANTSPARK
jgi:excisionase family DNA binding protein